MAWDPQRPPHTGTTVQKFRRHSLARPPSSFHHIALFFTGRSPNPYRVRVPSVRASSVLAMPSTVCVLRSSWTITKSYRTRNASTREVQTALSLISPHPQRTITLHHATTPSQPRARANHTNARSVDGARRRRASGRRRQSTIVPTRCGTAGRRASERRASGRPSVHRRASECRASGCRASGRRASERRASERRASERRVSGRRESGVRRGKWQMANGKWHMANGRWQMTANDGK